jgi:hypothetical protein
VFDVTVHQHVLAKDLRLMLRTALTGGSVTVAPENCLHVHRLDGSLVALLAPSRPRFMAYLCPPERHILTAKLLALLGHFRRSKTAYANLAWLAQVTPPS